MYPVIMNAQWPLFTQLEACKQRLGDAQMPAETLASLNDWFRTELTYTSNAIEGNTLTRLETDVVLNDGIAIGGKPVKDHIEAHNHAKAWNIVLEKSKTRAPLTEQDVLEIHGIVLRGLDDKAAGSYRGYQTFISGSRIVPPVPEELPKLMADFGKWLEQQPFTPLTAFHAHLRLVDIHPFVDGNGRTARLLANAILMKGGYLPVVVQPEDRQDYYAGIKSFTEDGSALTFAAFMSDALQKTYDFVEKGLSPERPASITMLPRKRPGARNNP